MKKIPNKKGFTLVELLAVIVVLAVIMVIATQAIGNVLEKNTVSSFKSSLDMVAKQAKQAYVMNGKDITVQDIRNLVDYDTEQYEIYLGNDDKLNKVSFKDTEGNTVDKEKLVCILTGANGKFHNMKLELLTSHVNNQTIFGDYCLDATCNWDKDASVTVTKGTSLGCYKYR